MNTVDPYDPDTALEAMRPRMAAVRRRRRALGASSAVALFALTGVAGASLGLPRSDDSETVVAATEPTSADDAETESKDMGGRAPTNEHNDQPRPMPTTVEVEVESEPIPTTTTPPPPPTTKPAPPPPPPPAPVAEQHTFSYEGTGTVTVSHVDGKVTFVGATAESGWTHRLSHDQGHMIGVEFRRGDVTRWLKVKSHNGTLHVDRHEKVACTPSATTKSGSAPQGAGTITVAMDGNGALALVSADPASGWTHQVLESGPGVVKVGFDGPGGNVWVKAWSADCELQFHGG